MANSLFASLRHFSAPARRQILALSNTTLANAARTLYSRESLGLDGFEAQRAQITTQMQGIESKFREKMLGYSTPDSNNMIFTEDLKNMIHLSASEEDLALVVQMMKKFNQQNKQLRFGSFVFGPVAMRLFYLNNKVDLALECFRAPELDGFFDQLVSYQLLLDLLYENGKYEEMLKTFAVIQDRQLEQTKYPRNIVVLTMAACYKLNSKASLDYALNLWKELSEAGHFPMRRAATFCAGLALNQDNPAAALEILSAVKNPNYTTVRNIKVAALAAVGRVDDAMPILKSVINADQPGDVAHTFNRDVLAVVKQAVDKLDSSDVLLEFERLEKLFKAQGHVSDMSLEEQLCSVIQKPPMQNRQTNRYSRFEPRFGGNKFNRRGGGGGGGYQNRPGLTDLN